MVDKLLFYNKNNYVDVKSNIKDKKFYTYESSETIKDINTAEINHLIPNTNYTAKPEYGSYKLHSGSRGGHIEITFKELRRIIKNSFKS